MRANTLTLPLSRMPPLAFFGRVFRRVLSRSRPGAYRNQRHIRLHLGCGAVRLPGFVNIDGNPSSRADLILDHERLDEAFDAQSVSEVVMIHALNYMNLWQARAFFRMLHRLMMPGGKLVLELPDIKKCLEKVLSGSGKFDAEYLEGLRPFYGFGLDHMDDRRDFVPYKFGWTGGHLVRELEEAGFSSVKVSPALTHESWRDMRIEATRA